jgi:hypothetical protein
VSWGKNEIFGHRIKKEQKAQVWGWQHSKVLKLEKLFKE